ncbi:MAG: RHS repeat-associated core domain-containing protein [bacterium]|nr:RHS repeat-associated core domain-containing protein [bacterium]
MKVIIEETSLYDKMNRLTDIYLGNTHSQIVYDPLGRMTDKQADGQTVFANAGFAAAQGQPSRPHAMTSAETVEGVFPSAPQEITYTGFDKVKTIAEGGNTLAYTYGYDQQRIRMMENIGDITRTKDYVGVCEYIAEDDGENTTEKTLTYLVGPYGVFAVVEQQDNEEAIHYILKDHLGSWTTITDAEGTVEQELSFDAWGNLRDPETWSGSYSGTPMFDRGFTGHEHMTAFGLINMNGRCYDPLTSSFLSVDAYVQDPTSAQAFNRYAYCGYNPLRYTDPTGWSPDGYGRQPQQQCYDPTARYHSDDPNDVLWGRSVHPCANSSSGYVNGTAVTSTGYTEGNGTSQNTTSSGITPKPIKTEEGYYLNIFTGRIEYNSGGENLLYNNGLLYMTSSDASIGDVEDVLNNWNLSYSTNPSVEGRYIVNTEAYIEGWNLWHTIPAMATFFAGMTADCFISTMVSFVNIANEIKISNQIRVQEKATKTVELLKVKEGGNVTVMKGEAPVFRVHQPGTHGQEGASITVFEKMKNPNTNQYFYHPSHKVQSFSNDSFWKLRQAEKKRFGYYLKTRGGR